MGFTVDGRYAFVLQNQHPSSVLSQISVFLMIHSCWGCCSEVSLCARSHAWVRARSCVVGCPFYVGPSLKLVFFHICHLSSSFSSRVPHTLNIIPIMTLQPNVCCDFGVKLNCKRKKTFVEICSWDLHCLKLLCCKPANFIFIKILHSFS